MNRGAALITVLAAVIPAASGIAEPLTSRVPTVGILAPRIPDTPLLDAFFRRLNELGYVEGRNIRIERRVVDADAIDRLSDLAADLVRRQVDVIFAASPPAIQAARRATSTIPIVIETLGDPVAAGFAASLSHPGHNVTGPAGLDPQLTSKRLELIKEAVPGALRAAVLRNPTNPTSPATLNELERTARLLGVSLRHVEIRRAAELEDAFSAMVRNHVDVLVMLADPMLNAERVRIVALAEKTRIPAVYGFSGMAEIGGLMVYGPNHFAMYGDAAVYVDKILRGAKPADLPIEQPATFDLVVNLKTAKALGLTIPQSILLRADRVIE